MDGVVEYVVQHQANVIITNVKESEECAKLQIQEKYQKEENTF